MLALGRVCVCKGCVEQLALQAHVQRAQRGEGVHAAHKLAHRSFTGESCDLRGDDMGNELTHSLNSSGA